MMILAFLSLFLSESVPQGFFSASVAGQLEAERFLMSEIEGYERELAAAFESAGSLADEAARVLELQN